MSTRDLESPSAAQCDAANARRHSAEGTAWLETFKWDHFVTLTCKLPLTAQRLRIAFENEFHRNLTRVAQQKVPWFLVVEGGSLSDVHVHAHCLISGTAAMPDGMIQRCWHRGFTRVAQYVHNGGAARYLTSKLFANPDGWIFSHKMPPLRSG